MKASNTQQKSQQTSSDITNELLGHTIDNVVITMKLLESKIRDQGKKLEQIHKLTSYYDVLEMSSTEEYFSKAIETINQINVIAKPEGMAYVKVPIKLMKDQPEFSEAD